MTSQQMGSVAVQEAATREIAAKYYDTVQGSYDVIWMNSRNLAMHYGFWDEGTKSLHEALVNENRCVGNLLQIAESDAVLDAGCGVGGTAIEFAETYTCEVTGVTVSERQLQRARRHVTKRSVHGLVNIELADYCATALPNESFDKAYAIESMCYALDKRRFLEEMHRLLKPGGALVIADCFLDGRPLGASEATCLQEWLDGWGVPNLPSVDGFRHACEQAGFTVSEERSMQEQIMPSAKRIWRIGRLFYPFDKTCNRLGLVSDETFGSTVACVAQYRLFAERVMNYRLLRMEKPL